MSIDQLIAQVRQSTDHQRNRRRLREQAQADLLVTHGEGLFRATPELIAFLATWEQDELYLEDEYQNPVRCDRPVLLQRCREHHQRVINRWHTQHEQLSRVRKI